MQRSTKVSISVWLGIKREGGTKLTMRGVHPFRFQKAGNDSDSMMDKMEDWHCLGCLYTSSKSSFECRKIFKNMDIAIHVILAMGLAYLSFCKTATGFMRCSVDLVVARWPIHPQFYPGWVNKQQVGA
jgi:hypothetical protein